MRMKSFHNLVIVWSIISGICLLGQTSNEKPEISKTEPTELEKTIREYERLKQKYPEKKDLNFNLGNLQYYNEDFSSAAEEFSKSVHSEDDNLKSQAHYNLGNTLYQTGEYEKSIEQYRKALELNPLDSDARHNYEFVQQVLQQQEQQQNNENKEDQNKQEEEENKSDNSQNNDSDSQDNQSENQESEEQQEQESQEDQQSESHEKDEEEQQQQQSEQSEEEQKSEESGKPQPQDQQELTQEQLLEREEAEAILNTLKASEDNLLKKKYKSGKRVKVLKDW